MRSLCLEFFLNPFLLVDGLICVRWLEKVFTTTVRLGVLGIFCILCSSFLYPRWSCCEGIENTGSRGDTIILECGRPKEICPACHDAGEVITL